MNRRLGALKVTLPLTAALTALVLGPVAVAHAAAPAIVELTALDHDHDHDHAHDHDHGLLGSDLTGFGTDAACGLLGAINVGGDVLCSHGPDTAPARTASADRPGSAIPNQALTCVDGGTTGQRVEVLHVYGPNGSAASSSRRAQVQRWVGQVEWTVAESAARHGGDRRVRWLMPSCKLSITSVRVSSTALRDFGTFIEELNDRGFNRRDRSYLTFVDATTYCGIATAPQDDDATNNAAERIPGYARVDRTCWGTGDDGFHSIAAHELFHTLGAVQSSAPHGTPGSHCTDEHDVMCYDDGTSNGTRTVCRDGSSSTDGAGDFFDRLLDCRGDDYFNPTPPSNSYLARSWNTADHARLYDPAAPKDEPAPSKSSDAPPTLSSDPIGYALYRVFR